MADGGSSCWGKHQVSPEGKVSVSDIFIGLAPFQIGSPSTVAPNKARPLQAVPCRTGERE